ANYIETTITGETATPLATAKLPRDVWDKLRAQAKQQGVKPEKLLEEIIGNYLDESSEPETQTEPEPEPPLTNETQVNQASLVEWESDLQQLVDRHFEEHGESNTTSDISSIREGESSLTKSEVKSQKSEVNQPLTTPRRENRGFEKSSKNISPSKAGLRDPYDFDKATSDLERPEKKGHC
ncbi:MAG: hypothetical protein SWX82_35375, partial [Cyanobacteriota bacterium]|nr:hypothetical protein [Cyanobacteriota bacterium]